MFKYKPVPHLRRTLWGVTRDHAARVWSEQEQELSARHEQVRAALAVQQQENARLTHEIGHLQKRLEMLRQVTDNLTHQVACSREKAGEAAKMLEAQIDRLEREHTATIGNLKFETVRMSAELQLERQSAREFLLELYKVLASRHLVSRGQEVLLPGAPPAEAPDPGESVWPPVMTGRIVRRTVQVPGGEVIARAGDRVSPATVEAAQRRNLLPDLVLAVWAP